MSASASAVQHAAFDPIGILLRMLTSNHGRRLLFVTSLYFRVVHLDRLKVDVISRLNSLMHLSTNDNAMMFPTLLRGFVWRKTPIESILDEDILDQNISEEHARHISLRIAEIAPKWIRYGSKEEMASDVFQLIMHGDEVAAA